MESWVDHWASAHRRPLEAAAPGPAAAVDASIPAPPLTTECSSGNATLQATDSENSFPDPSEYARESASGAAGPSQGSVAAAAGEAQLAPGGPAELPETPARSGADALSPAAEATTSGPQMPSAPAVAAAGIFESTSPEPEQRPVLKQVGRGARFRTTIQTYWLNRQP